MGFIRSFRRQMKRTAAQKGKHRKMHLEALEPRILLSTDPLSSTAAADPAVDLPLSPAEISVPDTLQPVDCGTQAVLQSQIPGETGAAESAFDVGDHDLAVRQLVLVDPAVPDAETLMKGLTAGPGTKTEIVYLEAGNDGVQQITEVLMDYTDVAAVHIISHGASGSLQLGVTQLNIETLERFAGRLASWADALAEDADILLYGCNAAEGAVGVEFVSRLAKLTGADIAASDDLTGSSVLGGDWDLEYHSGVVEASPLSEISALTGYSSLLAESLRINDQNWNDFKDKITDLENYGQNQYKDGTLDFTGIDYGPLEMTLEGVKTAIVKKGSETATFKHATGIISGNGNDTITLKSNAKGWNSIKGGGGNDTFKISGSPTLPKDPGSLDGGTGNNTLEFLDEGTTKSTVQRINLSDSQQTVTLPSGKSMQISAKDGNFFTNFQTIKGSNNRGGLFSNIKGDILIGTNDSDTFYGHIGEDTLYGLGGNDFLYGGPGDDVLDGGKGQDTLGGGPGSNTYKFSLEDLNVDGSVAADTVTTIAEDGKLDILDFSAITEKYDDKDVKLEVDVAMGGIQVKLKTKSDGAYEDKGNFFTSAVQNVEKFVFGKSVNAFTFQDNWDKSIHIKAIGDVNDGKVHLDFSAVTSDLVFEIGSDGKVTATRTLANGTQIIATAENVYDLTGGKGNNTYKFKSEKPLFGSLRPASLLGTLTGGSADQPAGKQNILDYSKYGADIAANLTGNDVTFSVDSPVTAAQGNGMLPVQAKWQFEVPLLKGSMSFGNDATPFDFVDTRDDAPNAKSVDEQRDRNSIDEQRFKKALSAALGRSDFSITKTANAQQTTWTVRFSEPEPVEGFDSRRDATKAGDGSLTVAIRDGVLDKLKTDEKKQIETGLKALENLIKDAVVTGSGTQADKWKVEYTSKEADLGGRQIVVWDVGVTVEAQSVAHTTYQQTISWNVAPETFQLQFEGQHARTITTTQAAADIKDWMTGLADIDQVEVTGEGTSEKPWIVKYRSGEDTLNATKTISATEGATTSSREKAHTTYAQDIHLNPGRTGDFKLGFGQVDVSRDQSPGVVPQNKTFEVYNTASGGTFKLFVSFNDRLGKLIKIEKTEAIVYNASPDQLQAILQKAIDSKVHQQKPNLDVWPKVLVSGMGTAAFPWYITLANMGEVVLQVMEPDPKVTTLSSIAKNSSSGISNGLEGAVARITQVIGSGKDDRIYGVPEAQAKEIKNFQLSQQEGGNQILDNKTLRLSDAVNLQTGQAVLYETDGAPIQGLDSGKVYYVGVDALPNNKTDISFYENPEEAAKHGKGDAQPIKLSSPSPGADNQHLYAVPRMSGGVGNDTLIAFINNAASAVLGGDGNDVIAGSNGIDYIDGGKGDDTVYGDGSHTAQGDAAGGQDIVLGGDGDDHLYGLDDTDHLVGGSGEDFLVGGAGSDLVEGGPGNDKLAVIEGGAATDYDRMQGDSGSDEYIFKGNWGVASLTEKGGLTASSSKDVIDLSSSGQNYVHVMSDGNLFSAPGTVFNHDLEHYTEIQLADGSKVRLATAYGDLVGGTPSPGQVLTEAGFGLHQVASGKTGKKVGDSEVNATLTALAKLPTIEINDELKVSLKEDLHFRLWVDRGSGGKAYNLKLNKGTYEKGDDANKPFQSLLDAGTAPAADSGLTLKVTKDYTLELTAKADGSLNAEGKARPARLELTAKSANAVVVGGKDNFQHFETIKLGDGAHTFLFGNDYWGGGTSSANALAQSIPLVGVVTRNFQDKLVVDTSALRADNNPLVLDFRAVNQELYFNFTPVACKSDAVKLTVRTVRDLELPLVGTGPEIRNQTIVFTEVDKHTIIYGGRYKNTFNFDQGASYKGHLIGGDGGGIGKARTFPGRTTDKLREVWGALESNFTELSASEFADALAWNVENTISYSNPNPIAASGAGFNFDTVASAANPFAVTHVNLEVLKNGGREASTATKVVQGLMGNLLPTVYDPFFSTTTGLGGLSENYWDASLGDVIIRSGINFVRGTDYNPMADTSLVNPFAIATSGADTIKIGDNPFSITPGFHFLAGGSGADTYEFNSQVWGAALVVDDLFSFDVSLGGGDSGVDTALGALLTTDKLDFGALYSDLHFSVFELSTNDIQGVQDLIKEHGGNPIPLELGASAVLVTPFDLFDDGLGSENFTLTKALAEVVGKGLPPNYALAIGVEDIAGGRGKNEFTFYDGAKLGGRIEPGFGGSLSIDYKHYHGLVNDDTDGITADLGASGIDFEVIPSFADWFGDDPPDWVTEIPDWAKSLVPSVRWQFGSAEGAGKGVLGVACGADVEGTAYDDTITGAANENEIFGFQGADTIIGGVGNDTLNGGDGNDIIRGGAGGSRRQQSVPRRGFG